MKKIINPWKGLEGYNCFGCAPNNEAGIKMEFYEDGDEVVSIWKPRPEYQGFIIFFIIYDFYLSFTSQI